MTHISADMTKDRTIEQLYRAQVDDQNELRRMKAERDAARAWAKAWKRAAKAERGRHHWFFKCYEELNEEISRSVALIDSERDALRTAAQLAREALERNPNNARIQAALVALNAVLGPKETYG